MMLPKEPYKKFAVIIFYIAVGIAVAYIVFNYLWSAILPFVIAYVFAECFRPVVKYSETHKTFPKRFFVLFVVLLATGSLAMLIYGIARRVFFETRELASNIAKAVELIRADDSYAAEIIEKINSFLPFVDLRERLWEMRDNLDEELWTMLISLGEKLSGNIFEVVGSAAAFLPKAVLSTAVVIIATYYFAIDRVKINNFFLSLFPQKIREHLKQSKEALTDTVGSFLRAYFLLFGITFFELLVAFMILKVEYSFVLALVIAIVDVLPVLGTGTVLVPWAVISFVSGNYGFGIGLLVTYALITVIRQVLEPKIVGRFIGLSPLAALASMYIGLRLMGLGGLIAFPLGAILIKRILEMRNKNENSVV